MLLKKQLLNYQQLFLSYFIHSNKKYIQLNNDLAERWQNIFKVDGICHQQKIQTCCNIISHQKVIFRKKKAFISLSLVTENSMIKLILRQNTLFKYI